MVKLRDGNPHRAVGFGDDAQCLGVEVHIDQPQIHDFGINPDTARGPVPELLFATFQLGFAIVTAALVSGAIADRAKFAAWMVFVPLWTVAVYAVVAHWVWARGGWLFSLGALDYAGGMVVEIVSGMSALALALVAGMMADFIWYVTPVPSAKDYVLTTLKDSTVANSPLIFPTTEDLAYHLTTLFPPVRPRGWIEIRMIDALPDPWWRVPVAVVAAVLDDDDVEARCRPVAGAWRSAATHGLLDPRLGDAARALAAATLRRLDRVGADPLTAELVGRWADDLSAGRNPPWT